MYVSAKWLNGRSQPCCAPAFPSNTSRNFHHRDDCVGPIVHGFSAICKASIALCLVSDRMVLSWTDLVMQSRTLVVCQDKASRIGRKPSRMANLIERSQRRSDSCQNTQSFCVSEARASGLRRAWLRASPAIHLIASVEAHCSREAVRSGLATSPVTHLECLQDAACKWASGQKSVKIESRIHRCVDSPCTYRG